MSNKGEHRNLDHERTDVPVRWPIYLGIGMLLTLPITVALISALMSTVWAPPKSPSGPDVSVALPASNAPRLQINPQADLAALQKRWDEQLHGTGWVNRKAGIVHVPIAQAEKHLLQTGLPKDIRPPGPSRVQPSAGGPMAGTDRAGNGAARPARNPSDGASAPLYRQGEMGR